MNEVSNVEDQPDGAAAVYDYAGEGWTFCCRTVMSLTGGHGGTSSGGGLPSTLANNSSTKLWCEAALAEWFNN